MSLDLSTPLQLIGRPVEFQRIVETLAQDDNLLITGVPGSGRRTLVRWGVEEVGAIALDIDCIRATDGERFLQLLAETISQNWEAAKIQHWVAENASEFFIFDSETQLKLLRSLNQKQLWQAFELLLQLPQIMAVDVDNVSRKGFTKIIINHRRYMLTRPYPIPSPQLILSCAQT